MLLILTDEGQEFESIYVDHSCDWPETREYVKMLAEKYPITILKPNVEGYDNLYDYCNRYKMIPSHNKKWCSQKFKTEPFNQFVEKPCFSLIGFSINEEHRATLSYEEKVEARYPLIEREIDRKECADIIKKHGLPVPIKSGCWFCPHQRVGQWKKLRRFHPDLYCKAKHLEDQEIEARQKKGKGPMYLEKKPLDKVVKEAQGVLFQEMQPPCHCGL